MEEWSRKEEWRKTMNLQGGREVEVDGEIRLQGGGSRGKME